MQRQPSQFTKAAVGDAAAGNPVDSFHTRPPSIDSMRGGFSLPASQRPPATRWPMTLIARLHCGDNERQKRQRGEEIWQTCGKLTRRLKHAIAAAV
jgi:hypothetical protein